MDDLSRLYRSGDASPAEVADECLGRIGEMNSRLNAFITISEHARRDAEAAAAEMQKGIWKGPLHGVPVALKDFYDTADMRTTAAFQHFKDRSPRNDAEVVTRLRNAGAVIIGKTNMHQLGMGTTSTESFFGPVHNPWNLNYIAAGSSGGSAAAVAAGLCYATIDTDAVGSCRLPAAACGVIGFKGTFGAISTRGILEGERADEMILQLAHAAVTCRSAGDVRHVMSVVSDIGAGKAQPDSAQGIRIGILKSYRATDVVEDAFRTAADALSRFALVGQSSASTPLTEKPSYKAKDVAEARASIQEILFADFDFLISPTMTDPILTFEAAAGRGPMAVSPENTFFANYFGLPAVSVPCGFDAAGMPIGLQIVGPAESDLRLLEVAERFLSETKWHLRHPE